MDKLSAYKILNLEYNASNEEIKEAYARLSKEYHPEENPEEFQRIHDAYVTLARGGRKSSGSIVYSQNRKSSVKREKTESDLVFHEISEEKEENEQEEQPEYDFEASIERNKERAEEELRQKTEQLVFELDELFSHSNYHQMKNFKLFFERKEYAEAFHTPKFMRKLSHQIRDTKLKPEIYSYIIEVYHLWNRPPGQLTQEEKSLSAAIDIYYSVEWDIVGKRKLFGQLFLIVLGIIVLFNCVNIFHFIAGVFNGEITIRDISKWIFVVPIAYSIYRIAYRYTSRVGAEIFAAGVMSMTGLLCICLNILDILFYTAGERVEFGISLMWIGFSCIMGTGIWILYDNATKS